METTTVRILHVFFLIQQLGISSCVPLCTNEYFGDNNPNNRRDWVDNGNVNMNYMMSYNNYKFDCCGVATRFQFYTRGVSTPRTIYMQIWRRVAGDTWGLVGEHDFTVDSDREWTFSITDPRSRITVMDGDRFGWWVAGPEIISYDSDWWTWQEDNNWRLSTAKISPGSSLDFTAREVLNNRAYAIRVDVRQNNQPTFPNLPDSVTIFNDHGANLPLFTVTIDDVDSWDTLTLWMTTTNTQFKFNATSGVISTVAITTQYSTNVLSFQLEDQCDNSRTQTFTVVVVNRPPTIHNTPNVTFLREDVKITKELYVIDASDPSDPVTCQMDPSVPATYPFELKQVPGTSDYGIYYQHATPAPLYYKTKSFYELPFTCDDGADTVYGEFFVYLVQNSRPTIRNLSNATVVSTNATKGTTAFQVETYDAEGDDLTCTMTCHPNCDPFTIWGAGIIEVSDVLTHYTQVAYDLFITVCDTWGNCDGPLTLTVDITDINFPVFITNLPFGSTRAVQENTALGTSVMHVSIWDSDPNQTPDYTMTASPTEGMLYFFLNSSTGLITTSGDVLNYESLAGGVTTYTFTVTVTDTVSSDTRTLAVNILNENEPPIFFPVVYGLTASEGKATDLVGTPSFAFTDVDNGDSHTYSIECGNSSIYFFIDAASGTLTYQMDYDVDPGTLLTSVTCNVTVTDDGGLTDTALLLITIVNINDNVPFFFPGTYAFYVSPYSPIGTLVGNTTAMDYDSGAFGSLSFRLDQAAIGGDLFGIDGSGVISINSNVNYSTSYVFHAIVEDAGGLTATATISVIVAPTTTAVPTTTTWRYQDFWDSPQNWAWFVPLFLLLLAVTGVSCWVACTCRGKLGCEATCAKLCQKRKMTLHRSSKQSLNKGGNQNPTHSVRQPPRPKEQQAWRQSRF